MKYLGLFAIILLLLVSQNSHSQSVKSELINISSITYSDQNGKEVPLAQVKEENLEYKLNYNKYEFKVFLEGDNTNYSLCILDYNEPCYSRVGAFAYDHIDVVHTRKLTFINEGVDLFNQIINKYFEWYNLAKSKGIKLEKQLYTTKEFGQIDFYSKRKSYNRGSPWTHPNNLLTPKKVNNDSKEIIKSMDVNFEMDWLKFEFLITKSTHEYRPWIWISFDQLKKIKAIIDSGKLDNEIKKMKTISNTWDDFKAL